MKKWFYTRIYEVSISEKRKTRIIFWTILVFINAIFGFLLWVWVDDLKIWMVLWILTWLFIYAFIVDYFYQKSSDFFRKSMFAAYFLKTLTVLIGISFIWDMVVWSFAIKYTEDIFQLLWSNIPRIEDSLYWDFSSYPILYPYITTLIHWWILSFYTFLLWIFSLFINIVRESIFYTSEKVRKKIF